MNRSPLPLPSYAILAMTLAASAILGPLTDGAAQAASIGLNFTGANESVADIFVPDTMGAVGCDHIVEMLNGVYTVYDKATGQQLQRMRLRTFWREAGQRGGISLGGDPAEPNTRWADYPILGFDADGVTIASFLLNIDEKQPRRRDS